MTRLYIKQPVGIMGSLSVSVSQGKDNYDYKSRAAIVRQTKEDLGIIDEFEPIHSPWTLEIEPTLRCNSHCCFCSYQEEISQYKYAQLQCDLSKNVVMRTLESVRDAGTTKGIYWSGGGEPLLWPHFAEMSKLAATFSDNFVQTNGISLCKFANNPENLAAIRLISISVFANNPHMHFLIGGVKSFERVIKGIKKTVMTKKQYDLNLTINAKVMVNTINFQDVIEIVNFYEDLGIDSIGLRLVQDYNYGGNGKRKQSVELSLEQKNKTADIINLSSYKNDSLLSFSQTLTNQTVTSDRAITRHCYNAIDGHFACIDAWGKVYLGNPEIGNDKFLIGNINEFPWSNIWKGKRHRSVIKSMDKAQKNGSCRYELCRHVKANIGAQEYIDGKIVPQDQKTVMQNLGAFL